ncbi:hypothetical protein Q8791_23640 [Nocardiopsis sp. CT-R113]|uniref:Uncharacterized protein n=1 Tax=Nocardiopsis codii TaxID=3065942 RepID=A0ABU7KD98_9ACTN|nr:hypothetical protein [Nocardiopsis sp. CT-R113]MEE2040213.1 hypothetical protein [Nocardiopsis sp. CT-R113]
MAATAREIANLITAAFDRIIDNADPYDWTDATRYNQYIACLRTGRARATGTRTITVTVHGHYGYKATTAIDCATDNIPETYENGMITEVNPSTYVFTW